MALLVTQVGPLRPASPILPVAHLELNLPPGVEPYTNVQAVALSPDGARVAFIGIVAGNSYPVWTPDGKCVVYRTATGLYAVR